MFDLYLYRESEHDVHVESCCTVTLLSLSSKSHVPDTVLCLVGILRDGIEMDMRFFAKIQFSPFCAKSFGNRVQN